MSAQPKYMVRLIALCLGIVLSALLTGCASLPADVLRLPSHSLSDDAHGPTRLTDVADASLPADDDNISGLRLLPGDQGSGRLGVWIVRIRVVKPLALLHGRRCLQA